MMFDFYDEKFSKKFQLNLKRFWIEKALASS